jgi:uncharacterized protein
MNQPVFADAFYYLALSNARDAAHALARSIGDHLNTPVVTSAWVVQELADGLSAPPARLGFLRLLATLEADRRTTIITPSADLWNKGLELYRSRPDKSWSLTDCISFEIMREHGITDALTADRHFEQAGFNILLKSP